MSEKQYEILALTFRYWFVFLVLLIFCKAAFAVWKDMWEKEHQQMAKGVPFVLALFAITAFMLLSLRNPRGIDGKVAVLGILVAGLFLFQYYLFIYVFKGMDPYLLVMVDILALIGFIILQRLNPSLAIRQIEWFGLGCVALILTFLLTVWIRKWDRFFYPLMIIGVVLLIIALVFGEETGGARNWFSIGSYNVQPSEFVKVILIFVLSIELKEHKPRRKRIISVLFAALSVILVVLQKDLGAAFLYFSIFILMYYIATSDWLVTLMSLGAGSIGAVFSYYFFYHVRVRIAAWKNPWADIEANGYQIAQSLIAISSGGLLGLGLGLGSPEVIPASRTDFIFAAICEEMGILVGAAIIGFYVLIMVRGAVISLNASSAFDALISMGATISLAVQSFIIIGGVVKMIPITGVTMPFVSYGGSSMLVSMALIGILQGAAVKQHKESIHSEDGNDLDDGHEANSEENEQ